MCFRPLKYDYRKICLLLVVKFLTIQNCTVATSKLNKLVHHRLVYVCIFGFKGASTSQVIGARNEMMMDDYDGQMIFGDLVGLKLPDIRLTGKEKPRKNLT